MELFKSFDELKKKYLSGNKKVYEIALCAFLLGILILICTKNIFKIGDEKASTVNTVNLSTTADKATLEQKISKILTNIRGAGKVDILITYEGGSEKIFAYETKKNEASNVKDASKEMDQESKIAYEEDTGGSKRPVIMKEIEPNPRGAIVIAEGADNESVRHNLCEAVSVLLKLPQYKIQVFASERSKLK